MMAYRCVFCMVEVGTGARRHAKTAKDHTTFACDTHQDYTLVCPSTPEWNCLPELHPARLFQIMAPLVNVYAKKVDVNHATTDITKKKFDTSMYNLTEAEWSAGEANRRHNKNIEMAIGTFHESVLASAPGCVRLKEGALGMYGMDILLPDQGIFVEVKNKFNTTNSNAFTTIKHNFEELVRAGKKGYYLTITPPPKGAIVLPDGVTHYSGESAYEIMYKRPGVFDQVTTMGSWLLLNKVSIPQMAEQLLGVYDVPRAPRAPRAAVA